MTYRIYDLIKKAEVMSICCLISIYDAQVRALFCSIMGEKGLDLELAVIGMKVTGCFTK